MNGTPRESPRDGVGFVEWVVASPGVTTTATYSARWRLSRESGSAQGLKSASSSLPLLSSHLLKSVVQCGEGKAGDGFCG